MENNTNDLKTWKKNISEISDPIAITGMSGRFPLSENIEEFSSNLYNAVDMTTSDNERYPHGKFSHFYVKSICEYYYK